MNKSELKKRILESLTPDEASKVDVKYKEIYAGMVGKNPLKMKKYDNPDKVAYGRAINLIKKESAKLSEKLGKDADLGDHIEDFQKSDAPQFQGKSKKKINQMAQAAFLNKEEQKLDEIDDMMEDAQDKSEKNYSNYFKKMDKNKLEEFVKEALKNPKKADLNKDGELSSYEKARATAIEKSIDKVDEDLLKKGSKISMALDALDRAAEEAALSGEQFKTLMAAFNKEMGLDEGYDSAPPNNNVFFKGPTKAGDKIDKDEDIKDEVDESYDTLVNKIKKQGKSGKAAKAIAGAVASYKAKGGGKGPTAKQK